MLGLSSERYDAYMVVISSFCKRVRRSMMYVSFFLFMFVVVCQSVSGVDEYDEVSSFVFVFFASHLSLSNNKDAIQARANK
jgi:hypothetical protein